MHREKFLVETQKEFLIEFRFLVELLELLKESRQKLQNEFLGR